MHFGIPPYFRRETMKEVEYKATFAFQPEHEAPTINDMDESTPFESPPEWIHAVERGRADLAAGRVVSIDAVIAKVRKARDRLQSQPERETSATDRGH